MNAPSHPSASGRPEGAQERSAFDWAHDARLGPELAGEVRREVRRRRRRRLGWAAGAAILVLVGVLGVPRPGPGEPPAPATGSLPALVSMPVRRVLTDGSTVELKDGAELRVEFAPAVRRVILLRGEAHFQVAKDAGRPFVVAASGVDVRAVGTAFSVELGERKVEVVVTEGIVAVNRARPAPAVAAANDPGSVTAPASEQRVAAGQQAMIPLAPVEATKVQAVATGELARRLAWRVPRLEFSGTPLSEVVALFRQHGGVRLAIGEASLAGVRVSGILRADNSSALLELLAADHAIVAVSRDGETLLVRRH